MCGGLHSPIGAYHSPITGRPAQMGQPGTDGLVGGQPLAHKAGDHSAKVARSRLSRRPVIKIYFHFFPSAVAEFLQQFHQLHFVVYRIQAQTRNFGNQVMTVDDVWHGSCFNIERTIRANRLILVSKFPRVNVG